MWFVVGRNDRNIVEAFSVAFDEGKFGSFVLDQMYTFFKAMSSWGWSRFVNSWNQAFKLEYRKRENNLREQLNFNESRFFKKLRLGRCQLSSSCLLFCVIAFLYI